MREGLLAYRVSDAGCDLKQRLENKAPLVHAGMRDAEIRSVDDAGAKEENVDIDDTRPFGLGDGAIPAQSKLDALKPSQELARKCVCGNFGDHVEKPGLAR